MALALLIPGALLVASGPASADVDVTPPETMLQSIGRTSTSLHEFTFNGTDPEPDASGVAGFECSTDAAAYVACVSPYTISSGAPGPHRIDIRAIDHAGNVDPTPAHWTWEVYDVIIDTATDGAGAAVPAGGSTTSTSMSFTFHLETGGLAPVGILCALDSTANATPCTSPITYTGLASGFHGFYVRADGGGLEDANWTDRPWRVLPPDTVSPETYVDSASDGDGAALASGGATTSTSLDLSFHGTDDRQLAGLECSLDAATFASCTSPHALTGLAPGPHTFEVRAYDAAGNVDATPARFEWTVIAPPDTTPPDTVIDSATDGDGATVASDGSTASTSLTLAFSGTDDVGMAGFECSLDAAAYATCTSPHTLTGLAPGAHTFEVRAVDAAGNVDPTPATFAWTILDPSPTGDFSDRGKSAPKVEGKPIGPGGASDGNRGSGRP